MNKRPWLEIPGQGQQKEECMSNIFTTETVTRPRPGANIRIEAYEPGRFETEGAGFKPNYVTAELLEYHPDHDYRMKARGFAYVRVNEALAARPNVGGVFGIQGEGYLEKPYAYVREFIIHPEDLQEMNRWCRQHDSDLVIEKQPRPFPLYPKGTRVTVLEYKTERYDTVAAGQAGQLATVEESSDGGMTTVIFDDPALNQGYKSIGVVSIALREAK